MRYDCKGIWRLCLRLFARRSVRGIASRIAGHLARRRPAPLARAGGRTCPGCVLAAAVLATAPAHAQVAASAALLSDYGVRGMTLSRGRPEPQLRLDYDASGGWYAGALASGVALADSGASLQLLAYGGYAHRLPDGVSWEAGLLDASFVHGAQYRYHEFYAGLARESLSARLYFSPAYYGQGKTVYGELNAAWPLRGRVSLSGHVGLLHPFGAGDDEARQRVDLRVGLGMDYGNLNLQVALSAAAPAGREAARKLAVGVTYSF